ncbi:DUF2752 domain-containing protein [Streptomyces lavendofoliae]|uniref:DUF2752 domain-containing protein n=1 Tax=Streptomyces lavendofoliae TaxID=67314 RepID=UPI003D8DABDE
MDPNPSPPAPAQPTVPATPSGPARPGPPAAPSAGATAPLPPDPPPAPAALPPLYGTPPAAYGAAPGPYMSVPRSLPRRLAPPLGTLAGVAAAFAYVGAIDPNEPGHYPVCPLFRLTGLLCPGCGGLRSAHAFIHGDLPTALGANAVAVAGYAVFAVAMVFWLAGAVRGRSVRITLRPVWWWSAGVVLALFSIVRNLPFGSALAP